MRPSDVSAVIVTRGGEDLTPVLASLAHFDETIVFDNSFGEDWKTYGRVRGIQKARNDIIFSTDDDIVHTPENQQRILDHYQPGVLVGCMWPEWSDGARQQGIENGYDDLVFMGSGSVFDRDLPQAAADRYLAEYPRDDFFLLWSDTIIGILAPTVQLDIRFEALPEAEAEYRMCNLPDAVEQKTEAIRRAREIRDRKLSWRELRLAEADARIERGYGAAHQRIRRTQVGA